MADEARGPRGVTRREFAVGALGAAAALGLGAAGAASTASAQGDHILRPPGGQDGGRLRARCVHCERCREACPHTAIRPLGVEDGLVYARTPVMDFRRGWCNFCEDASGARPLCERACPTGALSLAGVGVPKEDVVIGIAVINHDWCLAWRNRNCRVCVDACPYDALEFDASERPVVRAERCNGCGRCENVCISLSSNAVALDATDRAIVVRPQAEVGR